MMALRKVYLKKREGPLHLSVQNYRYLCWELRTAMSFQSDEGKVTKQKHPSGD